MSEHDDDFWTSLMGGQHAGQDSFGDFLAATPEADLTDVFPEGHMVEAGMVDGGYFTDLPKEAGGGYFEQCANLTDKYKVENAIYANPKAGTQVRFVANIGSVLAYDDTPDPDAIGTVVTVRSAGGDTTEYNGMVFTQWGDGKVRAIDATHLRFVADPEPTGKEASSMRVASLSIIASDFLKVSSDTLINKATKDLWSYKQEGGEYIIQRLFNDSGEPLKV